MPPPNTPTDPDEAAPAPTIPLHRNNNPVPTTTTTTHAEDNRPCIAKAWPSLFYTLVSAARLGRPLLFLTAASTLIPLRSRVALAWQGKIIPWAKVSKALFWASLAGWMSGRMLYVLTVLYWWRDVRVGDGEQGAAEGRLDGEGEGGT